MISEQKEGRKIRYKKIDNRRMHDYVRKKFEPNIISFKPMTSKID